MYMYLGWVTRRRKGETGETTTCLEEKNLVQDIFTVTWNPLHGLSTIMMSGKCANQWRLPGFE
jgi:hypothetical protein